jgi:VanZ family protein
MRIKSQYVWLTITIIVLSMLFMSSSTPYEKQSLVSPLERLFSGHQPFKAQLSGISFNWGGPVSIQAKGYYNFIEFFLRKAAHFTIFGLLGLSLWHNLKDFTSLIRFIVPITITLVMIFAGLDEFHQSLTPSRTPMWQDVALDTFGGIVFVTVATLVYRHAQKKGRHSS